VEIWKVWMSGMYLAHRRSPGLTPAAQFVYEILRDTAAEAAHAGS